MINGVNLNDLVQNQITFQPSINTVAGIQGRQLDVQRRVRPQLRRHRQHRDALGRQRRSHGEAFEFFRNDRLDSRNAFNTPPAPQSPFNRNQFERRSRRADRPKNRTFFFADLRGPPAAAGDRHQQRRPAATPSAPAVTDPISRQLLRSFLGDERHGANGAARFIGSATAPVDIDQWTGDVSHNVERQTTCVHGYYAFQRDLRQRADAAAQHDSRASATRAIRTVRSMTLNETHIFGQRLVNEARFGFNRINITFEPNLKAESGRLRDQRRRRPTAIGLPQITIVGPGLNFGGPSNFPQGRTDNDASCLGHGHACRAATTISSSAASSGASAT